MKSAFKCDEINTFNDRAKNLKELPYRAYNERDCKRTNQLINLIMRNLGHTFQIDMHKK